jgi:hypothetical protein
VGRNPNITWEIICDNPQIKWSWYAISSNQNITWDIICKNPDKPWDWDGISINPNITWEIILQLNTTVGWDWTEISKHPNITWEIVKANPTYPWDYSCMCSNPNISWEIVNENTHINWDTLKLVENPMTGSKNNFIRKKMQQWFTKSELKEELMASVWHPRNFEKFKYLDPETFGEDI